MKVLLDKNGFIQSYALIGDLVDGIDIPDPEDIDHFTEHYAAYKITDGKALLDETHQKALQTEAEKENLRNRREVECFSVINRGQLWYGMLTVKQIAELTAWYKAWLKVTETKVVPEKPSWLE